MVSCNQDMENLLGVAIRCGQDRPDEYGKTDGQDVKRGVAHNTPIHIQRFDSSVLQPNIDSENKKKGKWEEKMAIPRQCEYVYEKTGNRCHRLATKRGNPRWYCEEHLEEINLSTSHNSDLTENKKDSPKPCPECGRIKAWKYRLDKCPYCNKPQKRHILQMNEQDELLLDVLNQACGDGKGQIDNMCISAYEDACEYLKKKGILEDVNGRIFNIVDDGMDKDG